MTDDKPKPLVDEALLERLLLRKYDALEKDYLGTLHAQRIHEEVIVWIFFHSVFTQPLSVQLAPEIEAIRQEALRIEEGNGDSLATVYESPKDVPALSICCRFGVLVFYAANVIKIKEIMNSMKLSTPSWAQSLSDEVILDEAITLKGPNLRKQRYKDQ